MSKTVTGQKQQKVKSKRRKRSKFLTDAKSTADEEPLEVAIAESQVTSLQKLLQEWKDTP